MTSGIQIPQSHVDHREDFRAFVLESAEDWHRKHLSRLYEKWQSWNATFFEGALTVPHLLLSEPGSSTSLGDCATVSGWGSRSQIRIRPSLLTGRHRMVRPGDEFSDGRTRFAEDVLLHEIGHQYAQEVSGERETGYHGHGPRFRDLCNRIGQTIGLPPVRAAKARGRDKALPSCAHWPHCVRPDGYYLGAVIREPETDPEAGERERALATAEAKLVDSALLYGFGPPSDTRNAARLLAAAKGYASAAGRPAEATAQKLAPEKE